MSKQAAKVLPGDSNWYGSDPKKLGRFRAKLRQAIGVFVYGYFFVLFLLTLGLYGIVAWLHYPRTGAAVALIGLVTYYAWIASSTKHKRGPDWTPEKLEKLGQNLNPLSSYFPIHVVLSPKDEAKQTQKKSLGFTSESSYIFGIHPHGIHATGSLPFVNPHSPFYKEFPFLKGKIVSVVASVLFGIPYVRELFLRMGYRDCSRSVCQHLLQNGYSLSIVIGGEKESLESAPGTDRVVLKKRKGFVKLALRYGAKLVPTYAFNNTDLFQTYRWFSGFRVWLSDTFQICLPIFHGPCLSMLPYRRPVYVAVAEPIEVEKADLDANGDLMDLSLLEKYHKKYMESLEKLFEDCKHLAGYPKERKLEII